MYTNPKTKKPTPPTTPSPPVTPRGRDPPQRRDPIAAESYPSTHLPTISLRSPIYPITAASNEENIHLAIYKIEAIIYEVVINEVVINNQAIANAVNAVNNIAIAKKSTGLYVVDADDLCRMVIDRAGKETIKKFTTPELTDAEFAQFRQNVVKNTGGGSKKKRRTGKNTKSKTRTRNNSRTIKKMKIRRIRRIIK